MKIRNIISKGLKFCFDPLKLRRSSRKGDIFVFTTPRSGLTWLSEIFDSQPNTRCIREAFLLLREEVMCRYFKPHLRYLDLSERELRNIHRYVKDILSNKIFWLGYNPLHPGFKFKTDLNVLVMTKVCNLAPWFEETFSCRILYLVRHPIANALSKILNQWHEKEKSIEQGWGVFEFIDIFLKSRQFCEAYLTSDLVRWCRQIRDMGSLLERYVVTWCLENTVLIRHLSIRPWLLVTYEDLVLNPDMTLEWLAEHFGLCHVDRMKKRLNTPSGSTYMSEQETIKMIRSDDREKLVSLWRTKVSEAEIHKCFAILDAFGIDLYEPDSDTPNFKYKIYMQPHRPDLAESAVR